MTSSGPPLRPTEIPAIIDFEASGFGKDSYPIEVGFVGPAGNSWCSLIRPEDDWLQWDNTAEDVHHISRELLLSHGKSCEFVARQLNQALQGCIVYTDGWAHDYIWMARLFDAANTNPHFQLEDLRRVLTAQQEGLWHATKSAVEEELHATRHRASTDAKVLQLTWVRTCGVIPAFLPDY
jgi:hypothetical protein